MTRLALRGLYVGAVVAYVGVGLIVAVSLPDRVPLHFGASGAADSYGSRGEAVALFAAVGVGVVALFGACGWWVRRGSTQWVNVPHKDWWTASPEREAVLRRRLSEDMDAFAAATLLLLTGVVALLGRAARDDTGLGGGAWVLLVLYLGFVGAWSVWALTGRYRPRPDDADRAGPGGRP